MQMTPGGTIDETVARSKIPATVPKDQVDRVLAKCSGLSKYFKINYLELII